MDTVEHARTQTMLGVAALLLDVTFCAREFRERLAVLVSFKIGISITLYRSRNTLLLLSASHQFSGLVEFVLLQPE